MKQWVIGIDEVGRGPLAGPVAVGAVLLPHAFDWSELSGVRDSKQLTPARREILFAHACTLRTEGVLDFAVATTSASIIDQIGIVPAITQALQQALHTVVGTRVLPDEVQVLLDGGLLAPAEYSDQKTIVRGDSQEPSIALASVVAKVTRDTYMTQCAAKAAYHPYDFATHKGYGTKRHRAAIQKYGFSDEHRRSFCRNICIAE